MSRFLKAGTILPMSDKKVTLESQVSISFPGSDGNDAFAGFLATLGTATFQLNASQLLPYIYNPSTGARVPNECDECGKTIPDKPSVDKDGVTKLQAFCEACEALQPGKEAQRVEDERTAEARKKADEEKAKLQAEFDEGKARAEQELVDRQNKIEQDFQEKASELGKNPEPVPEPGAVPAGTSGEIPVDFPGHAPLARAGITTFAQLAVAEPTLETIDGIGPATAEAIRARIDALPV